MTGQYEIEAFYDGGCPLCRREVNMIQRLDKQHKILFSNIADPHFDFESRGKSFDQLMSQMHAQLSDGTWITGVEVFRSLYAAIGYGWLVFPTRFPGISQLLNVLYSAFAKKRFKLTGRCDDQSSCSLVTHKKNEVDVSE